MVQGDKDDDYDPSVLGLFAESEKAQKGIVFLISLELGVNKAEELKTVLSSMISNEISIMEGNKIIEVIPAGINKGIAAFDLFSSQEYDFVFVAGDDVTDEDMFEKLPEEVISIKIGHKQTAAKYTVGSSDKLIDILNNFTK